MLFATGFLIVLPIIVVVVEEMRDTRFINRLEKKASKRYRDNLDFLHILLWSLNFCKEISSLTPKIFS